LDGTSAVDMLGGGAKESSCKIDAATVQSGFYERDLFIFCG
jgi:hypothetical protein